MSFEKLKGFVGDNQEALEVIKSLESASTANVERINSLESQVNDIKSTRDKYKQGNSLVKDLLGLENINEESLSEFLSNNKAGKGDEKLTAELDNLKQLLEKANNEKESIATEYEGKLSNMALTNAIRDLGIGSLASSPIAEQTILNYLKEGATLEDGKIVYKKEDGSTVYNGTSIMTPAEKLESLKSDENWKPFIKADINSGSGTREPQSASNTSNFGGNKEDRTNAIKQKFKLA